MPTGWAATRERDVGPHPARSGRRRRSHRISGEGGVTDPPRAEAAQADRVSKIVSRMLMARTLPDRGAMPRFSLSVAPDARPHSLSSSRKARSPPFSRNITASPSSLEQDDELPPSMVLAS